MKRTQVQLTVEQEPGQKSRSGMYIRCTRPAPMYRCGSYFTIHSTTFLRSVLQRSHCIQAKPAMKSLIAILAALAASATAQSLTEILSSTRAVSELNTLLQNFPDLVATLASTSNITILAPANFALADFVTTPTGQQFTSDRVFARSVLSYHVLQGTYSAEDMLAIESDEQGAFFARTLLTPGVSGGVYANVSRGQTVEAVPMVDDSEDLTLFAPTNQGFQNIGSATGDLSTEQLTEILLYHAVSGVNYLNTLEDGAVLQTVQGGTLTVTVREVEGEVITFINGVRVVNSNFPVANGVVHGIDK